MKMKTAMALGIACLSPQVAQAGFVCLDAGGFYGSIQVSQQPEGIRIEAGYPYASKLSRQLGLPEVHSLQLTLPHACGQEGEQIRCKGAGTLTHRTLGELAANVDLKVDTLAEGHSVELAIELPAEGKAASAAHQFVPWLGECRFSR